MFYLRKHVIFHFISGPNYKNLRRNTSLETLLPKYIIDFSVLHIVIINDVTSMFNRKDQCWETNRRNKTYLNTNTQDLDECQLYNQDNLSVSTKKGKNVTLPRILLKDEFGKYKKHTT